jgi:Na+/H+ antiporter NhaD/arsenite permease-like protein
MILKIILLAIATEAVVEILLESELFEWLRAIMRKTEFTAALFSCGWCLSVWVATFWFSMSAIGLYWLAIPIVIHRIANLYHNLTHWMEREKLEDEDD